MKTKMCPVRMSESDNSLLDFKAIFLGISKSALMRDGAFIHWADKGMDAEKILSMYKSSNSEEKNQLINMLFEHYRRTGYPHNKLSSTKIAKQMQQIAKSKTPLMDEDNLQTNTVGLPLVNFYHPHMLKVRCLKKYKSPYELFTDDDGFRDAIRAWLDLGKKPDPSGIRRILRTRDGTRSVVNFKPVIARYLYDTYAPANGRVLDPCAGYGGRLAGCIASNKGLHYHGIDPMGATAVGNMKMASFFNSQYGTFEDKMWNFGFTFDLGCAEDVMPKLVSESYDLIFTSPPYFDVEQYSHEKTQSFVRYPTYDVWREKFLFSVLNESCRLAKVGGYVIFNVKNYKKAPIADDLSAFLLSKGMELIKVYQMRMPNSEFHRKEGKQWHGEPIFVFRKN